MNSNALIIFLLGMLGFLAFKPDQFYENGKLKSWQGINFDNIDTLYNVYVYAIVLAIFAHYITKKKT